MAIQDPLVLSINGNSKSLNRINQDNYGSEFLLTESLAEYRAKVRHSKLKPDRNGIAYCNHNFEIVITTYATESTPESYEKFYFNMIRKPGVVDVDLPDAVADLMIASTDAFLLKLNTWQI